MFKEALQGLISPQIQGMQGQQMPFQMPMPQMQQQPMQQAFDPYGQQQGGLRQALMGRMQNVRL
jgi:hypothetical protein